MKLLTALTLSVSLLAPLPALADSHAAATVTIDGILEYASVGQSVFVTEGENGAPETMEIGMVLVLVDADNPELTFDGVVNTVVTENDQPTGSWTVLLTE